MRNYYVRFWCLFPVFLFVSFLAGCDVENVEYEDDDTYALFDRPGMAPTNAEIQTALGIIAAGVPVNAIPGAYATLMDFLEVTVPSGDISPATFTVAEISNLVNGTGVNFCGLNMQFVITEILKAAIAESKKPGFDPEDPENSSLLAVVESLRNLGILNVAQINTNVLLSHGDLLLLITSIYQSSTPDPAINRWAVLIHAVLDDNSCTVAGIALPSLEVFILSATGITVSAPHQGAIFVL